MMHVLLVDDEPPLLELTKFFLERAGNISVDTATSAQKALSMMVGKRYDALVVDYRMPETNGLELLKILRSRKDDTPFILFTGKGREDVAIEALNSGANYYLQKGGDPKAQFAELVNMISTSVTQRLTSEALRQSEDSYRLIAENITDTVWLMDMDLRTTFITPSVTKARGFTIEELREMSLEEHMTPDSAERAMRVLSEELTEERLKDKDLRIHRELELEFYRKDGSTFWSEVELSLVRDGAGKPTGILGVGRDITAWRGAEAAFVERESRSLLKAKRESDEGHGEFFDNANDAIFVADLDGNLIDVNIVACTRLGYTKDELLKMTIRDVDSPEFGLLSKGRILELSEKERTLFETAHVTKAGRIIPTEISARLIVRRGRPAILSIARDITKRKQAEEEAAVAREKLQTIIRTSPLAILTIDESGRVTSWNAASERIFGWSEKEAVGRILPLVPEDKMVESENLRKKAITEGALSGIEITWLRKDGTPIDVNLSVAVIRDPKGLPTGLMAIAEDVTERKKTERMIRENEQRLRLITENLKDLIGQVDSKGNFIYLSSSHKEILGYDDLTQFIGHSITEYARPEDAKSFSDALVHTMTTNEINPFQVRIGRKDGGYVWLEVVSNLIYELGAVTGAVYVARDITERKQAQEALAKEHERRREVEGILNRSSVVVVLWRAEAGYPIDFISENVSQFGYTSDDFVQGRIGYEEIIHPEDRARVLTEVADFVARNQNEYRQEYRVLTKSGEARCVADRTTVRVGPDGKTTHHEGILLDITDWKKAEDLLRESEEALSRAQAITHVGNWYYSLTTGRSTWSPELFKIFGLDPYRAQPVSFEGLREHLHPDDWSRLTVAVEKASKEGVGYELDLRVIRPDGEVRYAKTRAEVERTSDGTVARLMGTLQDITDFRRVEDKVLQLSRAVEQSPSIAVITDASGNIEYVNPKFTDLTGYSFEEVKGKNPRILKSGRTTREEYEELWRTILGGKVWHGEFLNKKKNNDLYWESASISSLSDAKGAITHFVAVKQDITERKRIEEALEQANKKLNLMGSLTRHDALNQLTVLMGWLNVAMESTTDATLLRYMTDVKSAAMTIQKQLEFTSDYQEMGIKKPSWIAVSDAVSRGTSGTVPREVSLKVDVGDIEVYADPMFEKVFHNLLENAVMHGETVRTVSVFCEPADDGIKVVCHDDGVGIPVEHKERIFERGFGKHTGLGLYMAREVLGITGISLAETGEPGKGARFEMFVPKEKFRHAGGADTGERESAN